MMANNSGIGNGSLRCGREQCVRRAARMKSASTAIRQGRSQGMDGDCRHQARHQDAAKTNPDRRPQERA